MSDVISALHSPAMLILFLTILLPATTQSVGQFEPQPS